MDFIWIIVLAALGIAMIVKPEILWKIEHIFTVKNGEPYDTDGLGKKTASNR